MEKMQESGLTEIIPFICISATLGPYPVSSLMSSSVLTAGRGYSLVTARLCRYSSPSRVPQRAGVTGDCDILVYCYTGNTPFLRGYRKAFVPGAPLSPFWYQWFVHLNPLSHWEFFKQILWFPEIKANWNLIFRVCTFIEMNGKSRVNWADVSLGESFSRKLGREGKRWSWPDKPTFLVVFRKQSGRSFFPSRPPHWG